MGSKTISIPEDVYRKLREERRPDESFGDTVDRLLGGRPLDDFWGTWDDTTAERAREAIATSRSRNDDRLAGLYD